MLHQQQGAPAQPRPPPATAGGGGGTTPILRLIRSAPNGEATIKLLSDVVADAATNLLLNARQRAVISTGLASSTADPPASASDPRGVFSSPIPRPSGSGGIFSSPVPRPSPSQTGLGGVPQPRHPGFPPPPNDLCVPGRKRSPPPPGGVQWGGGGPRGRNRGWGRGGAGRGGGRGGGRLREAW